MKITVLTAATLGLALALPAIAVEPNVESGMWETTSTVTMSTPQFSMPARSETRSECVTPEKIAEGQAFLEQSGECSVDSKDVRADGMDYAMTCEGADMGTLKMNVSMAFNGDTMSGTVDGAMNSAMGEMTMKVEMSAKRTGDC